MSVQINILKQNREDIYFYKREYEKRYKSNDDDNFGALDSEQSGPEISNHNNSWIER